MGENTNIQWCSHSWSPWKGCQHATLLDGTPHIGCTSCYAEAMSKRNPATLGTWGPDGTRVITAPSGWDKIRKLHDRVPVGERQTVFPSICDPFEEWTGPISDHNGLYWAANVISGRKTEPRWDNNFAFDERHYLMADLRREFFELIDETPRFTWLILTKRPGNVLNCWNASDPRPAGNLQRHRPNVMLGTSISDQATADELIPPLLQCRDLCAGLFVSAEPLIDKIDIERYLLRPATSGICGPDNWNGRFVCDAGHVARRYLKSEELGYNACLKGDCRKPVHMADLAISWLIIGGESGHNHREMPIAAAESLAAQCQAAGVPCFVKQDSGKLPGKQGRLSEAMWALKQFPEAPQ